MSGPYTQREQAEVLVQFWGSADRAIQKIEACRSEPLSTAERRRLRNVRRLLEAMVEEREALK